MSDIPSNLKSGQDHLNLNVQEIIALGLVISIYLFIFKSAKNYIVLYMLHKNTPLPDDKHIHIPDTKLALRCIRDQFLQNIRGPCNFGSVMDNIFDQGRIPTVETCPNPTFKVILQTIYPYVHSIVTRGIQEDKDFTWIAQQCVYLLDNQLSTSDETIQQLYEKMLADGSLSAACERIDKIDYVWNMMSPKNMKPWQKKVYDLVNNFNLDCDE